MRWLVALSLGVLAASCGSSTEGSGKDAGPGGEDAGSQDAGAGGATHGDSDSGNASTGASSSSSTGSSSNFAECAKSTESGRLSQANLLFVLDKSGSMVCNPPDGDQDLADACKVKPETLNPDQDTKWEVTEAALVSALHDLAERNDNVSAGVSTFPKTDPDDALTQCLVTEGTDVAIEKLDAAHLAVIEDFLDGVEPLGETPIAGATILSYKYLSEELVEKRLEGNTFVVLLTDGAETCDDDRPEVLSDFLKEDIANATKFNIRTFVIGAPGSEDGRSFLSEIAKQGQTERAPGCSHGSTDPLEGDCHFDMTTADDLAAELSEALAAIADDRTLSCVFDVPGGKGKVDLNKVNVTFTSGDGATLDILKDDKEKCDAGAQGWQYSADFSSIVLCGDVCDQVRADSEGRVSIVLGCPTVQVK